MVAILGLQDSTWSLVLIYPTITIPVSVWLLIGFLKAVPRDLEEQAMVDGYSRLGAFVRTVIRSRCRESSRSWSSRSP